MEQKNWKEIWQQEENIAHIHGWDFSHIHDRCEEQPLPWDYRKIIEQHLNADMRILDYDTGGGEFLLSLGHPYEKTAATEGYPPNVALCKEVLLPLGIDFRPCENPEKIPFPDESFDMIINRHGSYDARELHRLLKKGGLFITQQVGGDNDRELVKMVLPDAEKPFPDQCLSTQAKAFEAAGFQLIQSHEAFCPIRFLDVGAFVWFARVIPWEFPGFSVENCYDRLLAMQKTVAEKGFIQGTTHRFMIVAKK